MRTSPGNKLYRSYLVSVTTVAILMLASVSALAEEGTAEGGTTEGGVDTAGSSEESPDPGAPSPDDTTAAADDAQEPAPAEPAPAEPTPEESAPVPTAAPARPEPPTAGYNKGFFIASPDGAFGLVINGRIQARFSYENSDGVPRENTAQFSIPRARLKVRGHAFGKRIAFTLEIDFGNGGFRLKDAAADFNLIDRKLMVQVGQFKRPFSRQQITSSAKLQFVDRAITDKHFKGGRDLGIMLHSQGGLPFEYAVGLFNGSGDKGLLAGKVSVDPSTGDGEITSGRFSNVPKLMDPMVVARVGWHSEGFDGYTSGDYEGSDFGIGIGGGVMLDFDSDDDDDSTIRAGIDYALALRGLSSTGAIYFASAQDGEGFADQRFDSVGFHVQAGYVIKGKVEPVVRYARIMPAGGDGASQEILGGVNVFCHGHNIKWSTDFGILTVEADGEDSVDFRARSQVQLAF